MGVKTARWFPYWPWSARWQLDPSRQWLGGALFRRRLSWCRWHCGYTRTATYSDETTIGVDERGLVIAMRNLDMDGSCSHTSQKDAVTLDDRAALFNIKWSEIVGCGWREGIVRRETGGWKMMSGGLGLALAFRHWMQEWTTLRRICRAPMML